jgi:mannosylglycerate hydrolase
MENMLESATRTEKPSFQVTVVSHTHWDRAWYVTFQEFRTRLVRLVDRLLNLLETEPDYRVFMLDGQMVVLEDYLEVRPQRQDVIERLCRSGRLKVGPWYVLADEFLVSPEALIRNLQLGHRMGQTYGGVSKIGYVPDGFGHIAQLPQILRGFGIDNAFFWRGIGSEGELLGSEFIWKAPDGSQVTTIWMPFGYHNISNLGYPVHWGDTSQMEFDSGLALQQIQTAIQALSPFANTQALLLMNGIDHEEPEPRLPDILTKAKTHLKPQQFFHGTLEEHLTRVRQSGDILPEFTGEFRWGRYAEILQGVYATRIYLKQSNHQVETLLERYSEPLSALAKWSGADVPEGTQDLLWTAWRWLLKNQPHDDIYGSGIDEVHDEMMYRFDQAKQIGSILIRDSIRQLARQVNFTCQPGIPVLVFNPLGWERQETVLGEIEFDFDDPTSSNFQIKTVDGQDVPFQILEEGEAFWMETLKANRKRRVKIAFYARVPACGYASFYIQPASSQAFASPEVPILVEETWNVFTNEAENRFVKISITSDGGVDVLDKTTGVLYSGLAHFEDCEDTGDEYSFCPLPDSQVVSTAGQLAQVRQVVAGANQVTFEIQRLLDIPEGLTHDRKKRSERAIKMSIVTHLTLYRHMPGVYFETVVENVARDHKLSVVFPTQLNPEKVHVDQPFMVMPRTIELPDSNSWVEDPTPLMHQRAFTDLSQSGHGLAVLNRGLPAVEVKRHGPGTQIALILLRSVGWLSRDDLWTRRVAAGPLVPAPGAQCLGKYQFDYAVLPHSGDWRQVYPTAYNFNAPLKAVRADTHEGLDLREMNITRDDPDSIRYLLWPRQGPLPPAGSFITVDHPGIVLSSLHQSRFGSNLTVRFYNIYSHTVSFCLTSLVELKHAWLTDLNEDRLEVLPLQDTHSLVLEAGACQVITVELCQKNTDHWDFP